jgi:type I restriction enzyme, S subunit
MSGDWPFVRLGDLAEIKHGWPFKSEFFAIDGNDSSLPIVVAIGNFEYSGGFRFGTTQTKRYSDAYPAEYTLNSGEILLVMTCQTAGGEILGIPARVPNDGRIYLHNQRLGRVVPKTNGVSKGFLYWLFLHTDFNRHLVNSASGTKILHTAPTRIESYQFSSVPTFSHQHLVS